MAFDLKDIDHIIELRGRSKASCIPILQDIQKRYRYLPDKAMQYVCDQTEITPSELVGVASFYSQFRMEPVGDHIVKVCVGTACHVKGAGQVHDAFRRHFKLEPGKSTDASRKFTVEEVSCLGCCTLAPVVQIDDVTYGHVEASKVGNVLKDFEYQKNKKARKRPKLDGVESYDGEIRIGLGSCCVASGSDDIRKAIEETVVDHKINVKLKHVGCVGMCHQVPLVEVFDKKNNETLYAKVQPEDIRGIVEKHFVSNNPFQKLKNKFISAIDIIRSDDGWDGVQRYELNVRDKHVSSFLDNQVPIATEHRGVINPLDLDEYKHTGGFGGLKKVLAGMSPEKVVEEINKSGIRGRGGAGFPTGRKWALVAAQEADEKFLICNGDEGDPGAFMDRMLLESYPYRVIEGIIIGAYAVKATKGFFYIRAEYPLAVSRIRAALQVCREKGLLGENILDSGFSFDITISEGAGAFVCGEETALIASIEGKRGFPRIRPPFPAIEGLWGKPTLVNNTETFSLISWIIRNGSKKFSDIGTDNSKGTKVFSLAGKIARGGLIEVPMGITLNQVVNNIGGGVANGKKLKAVQIGGPSGGCIPHWLADTPIDFNSLTEVGAMMGSGGLVVLDETDCMVDIAKYFLTFTQDESCGKCTFCRIGTKRMLDILTRLSEGKGQMSDLEELDKIAQWTKKGSLCGLGKTAPNPVLSTLEYFRDEYEAHVNGTCPAGKCEALITYTVNDKCIGCTKCVQDCPVDAIPFTPHEKHHIDTELCIKCDACRQVCPENAIDVF